MPDLTENYWNLTTTSKNSLLVWLRANNLEPGGISPDKGLKYHPRRQTVSGHQFLLTPEGKAVPDDKGSAVTVPFRRRMSTPPPVLEYIK